MKDTTRESISRISLIVFVILLLLSTLLLSVPGDYTLVYAIMGLFAVPPLFLRVEKHRVLACAAMCLAVVLIVIDQARALCIENECARRFRHPTSGRSMI